MNNRIIDQLPIISIIIPVRNEGKYIKKTIQSVLQNEYPLDKIEIIVVDGQSDDNTRTEVENSIKLNPQIHLLSNPKRIVTTAINIGIRHATGEIVFLLGGHAEFLPRHLERVARFLMENPEYGCAGAPLETINDTDTGKAIQCAMSSPFGVGNAKFRTTDFEGDVDTVAFGGYRREIFSKVGLFDEELIRNQDDEFNYRLWKNGIPIFMLGQIGARYYSRSTFQSLCRQYFQYGFWKIRVMQKLKKVPSFRSMVPLLFITGFFIMSGIGILWNYSALLIYTGLYFIFVLTGTYYKRHDCSNYWKVMFAFMILHFSYGIGEVLGILKYYLRLKIKEQLKLSR